ncbi:MAG: ATP-binding region, ATPase domain protein [Marmoricola sp.]|jgi:anti-sigma regulatory factor (Ser/Thr protein kinase)|nr:ATP-binding region, ATPase domain protein [Marmoricola sp.]
MARAWVTGVLTDIGRPELVPSAQLAVSELVTNAILHSDPPVTVRVRGTLDHPRIEVADQSLLPPRPARDLSNDDDHLSTVGRGLALVAIHSIKWGSDIDDTGTGKTVWFEPALEVQEDADLEGNLFDLDEVMHRRLGDRVPDEDLVRIQLINMPVALFGHLRTHYMDLRRELRLLALTDPERYPLATEVTDVFLQVEEERRQAVGVADLDEALANGDQSVDLEYGVPPTAPGTMGRMRDLLNEAYVHFADEHLLSITPTPQLLALQHWYLSEFERQGTGGTPRPWSGDVALEPSQTAS